MLAIIPILLMAALAGGHAQPNDGGESLFGEDALFTTPVGGTEKTHATANRIPILGRPFRSALRVVIGAEAPETNATQLTIPNPKPVKKGDALLAAFSLRGSAAEGRGPARMMLLFERAVSPWTKSVSQGLSFGKSRETWKHVLIPFTAAEDYAPGQAMLSLRFAFGPQTIEVGGLTVTNYGKSRSADELKRLAAERNPLGRTDIHVNLRDVRQTIQGFGGNFCQPRYGATEPMDAVGRYNLEHLQVAHARVGLPLNYWSPERGVYRDAAQAHAAFLQLKEITARKIPITVSIWEGPAWLLGGRPEQMGRTLPTEKVADCAEAIAQFLVTARDKYDVTVDDVSFNEPDYGVNFRFTPAQMAAFIRVAGPRFKALGLKTRFLVADTAGGMQFVAYARPLLEDREIAPYLGPLAFHCWDALGAPDDRYAEIAALGKEFHKPVWCTEAGHDAQLWQAPNPWASWDNALGTALAYEKTLRLTGASVMDYWTYQDNYPLVSKDGTRPYPVFGILRQLQDLAPAGSRVASAQSDNDDLRVLAIDGARARQFALLLVNSIGEGEAHIIGLPAGSRVTVQRSAASGTSAPEQVKVNSDGSLNIKVPARSVVTLMGR